MNAFIFCVVLWQSTSSSSSSSKYSYRFFSSVALWLLTYYDYSFKGHYYFIPKGLMQRKVGKFLRTIRYSGMITNFWLLLQVSNLIFFVHYNSLVDNCNQKNKRKTFSLRWKHDLLIGPKTNLLVFVEEIIILISLKNITKKLSPFIILTIYQWAFLVVNLFLDKTIIFLFFCVVGIKCTFWRAI